MKNRILLINVILTVFLINVSFIYAIPPAAPPPPPPAEKPWEPPEPPPPEIEWEPETPPPPGEPPPTSIPPTATPTPCIPAPCYFKVTECCFSMGCLLLGTGSERCDAKNVQKPRTLTTTKETVEQKGVPTPFFLKVVQFLLSLF